MARDLVNKATSTSNDPTPGYLYNEIARATLSGYNENRQVVNALVVRTKSRNHNVKWKALQVIKHVALQGLPTFKRDILRELSQQGLIQDCLQFTGPPDPLRGEEIYRRVQAAARETMEVLNSSDVAPQVSTPLEGLGGQPPVEATEPTTRLGQMRERLGGAAAAAGSMKNKAMHSMGKLGGRAGYNDFNEPTQSSYPASSGSGPQAQVSSKPQEKRSTVRMVTKNVRNLAFMRSGQLKENLSANEDANCSFEPPQFQDVVASKPEIDVSQGGEYDGYLVRELCTPGGLRAAPPKDELESFLRKVPSLDVELIGWSIINEIATTAVWQVRSKALAVVASLLQTPVAEAYVEFFAVNSEEIEALVGQKPASVSTKAQAILSQIGVRTEAADSKGGISIAQEDQRAVAPEICSRSEIDLLGEFFSGPARAPAAPEPATSSQPAGSLFAGLTMGPSAPQPQPILATDPFGQSTASSLLPEYLPQPTPFDSVDLLHPMTPMAPVPPLCDKPDSKDPTVGILDLFSAPYTQVRFFHSVRLQPSSRIPLVALSR